jgi:hypothetical protein
MDMASLADLVLLGMGSGSIDHRYPGQLQSLTDHQSTRVLEDRSERMLLPT